MSRFIACLIGVFVVTCGSVQAKPNVVLIVADDFGQRDLGCYGSTYYRTPNLDKLAKDGIQYSNAYAACPVCSPTRAAIMTGKYPARLNLTDWLPGRGDRPDQKLNRPTIRQQLPLDEMTLAEVLKEAGYTTGIIGKWHLGGEGFEPTRQGFQVNIAGDHTGTPLSYFAPFRSKKRTMPGLETAPEGEYLTDRLAAEAAKFITANKEKPFFLYLPHYAVHTPMQAKDEIIAKYKGTPAGGRQSNPIYAAMVESMDEAVGRVLKTLDELDLAKNTYVIFTSDNGGLATTEGPNTPATYNGPLREGKGWLYEGGIRVPLIMRGPGIRPSRNTSTSASSIDLFPTVLDFCEVKSPAKVDGVSVVPRADNAVSRDALYWHYPHYANQGGKPGGVIISGNYKLIEFYENGRRELFDLQKDQGEGRNLAVEKPEIVKELAAKLDAWRKDVNAQMPTPNPQYVPNPQAQDDTVLLHSRTAEVHGVQLRYEPLPHKNTLGFWVNPADYATFECTITKPGTFTVEVLQGCGKGSGGSEVEISSGSSKLTFTVKDTGGFQAFEARDVGTLTLDKPGRHTITVRPLKKPGVAVMDLRQMVLKPKNS